ncbi:MAG TPA: TIGR03546 family protein [Desulfuromonadales bacterium]|nr:TIGR03546 family protein [Desulfuromonadales bacterium]
MLRLLARLLKALNSESDPGQISLALCFAMICGFTPLFSPHNIIVLFLALVLRVNLSGFLVGLPVFSALSYALDPLFHRFGLALLTAEPLQGFWTALYNTTFFRLDRFNNSIVMGSLVFSLIAFVPCYFLFNRLIRAYRSQVMEWVRKSRIAVAIKGSKFYQIYRTVSGWRA